MAFGRDRTLISDNGGGTIQPGYLGPDPSYKAFPSSSSRCIDIVGNPNGANPLEITHRKWEKVGTFSGKAAGYTYKAWPFTNQGIGPGSSHPFNPTLPSDVATITEVQARTNPSRPEVSMPQFLGELRDIPKTLYLKGENHAKNRTHGGSAVEYNFGWGALISDLLKLADFTNQVDRRLKELEALHSSGLRRRMTVFDESSVGSSAAVTFNSALSVSITGKVNYYSRTRKWGSVQWIPQVPFKGTDGELASLARRIVHGWDLSLGSYSSTLWNLLPWSWFSDYFFNLGDYLDSQRNGVGAVARLGCVMTNIRTVWSQEVKKPVQPNITASAGHYILEQKFRVLASAGLSATVPFLSAGQLVTLSSIAQSLGK